MELVAVVVMGVAATAVAVALEAALAVVLIGHPAPEVGRTAATAVRLLATQPLRRDAPVAAAVAVVTAVDTAAVTITAAPRVRPEPRG
jgi:hypothetical protein